MVLSFSEPRRASDVDPTLLLSLPPKKRVARRGQRRLNVSIAQSPWLNFLLSLSFGLVSPFPPCLSDAIALQSACSGRDNFLGWSLGWVDMVMDWSKWPWKMGASGGSMRLPTGGCRLVPPAQAILCCTVGSKVVWQAGCCRAIRLPNGGVRERQNILQQKEDRRARNGREDLARPDVWLLKVAGVMGIIEVSILKRARRRTGWERRGLDQMGQVQLILLAQVLRI